MLHFPILHLAKLILSSPNSGPDPNTVASDPPCIEDSHVNATTTTCNDPIGIG